ncbi:hypothetical protein F7230_06165 [Corynebacterium sp. 320]|uniref:hypothetical protein n=1 Tax=Corynebacterium TaxID=1716 RepID=UPI00125CCE02|nr:MULTISPECIES: hypothetical protein [Corynebacterium]KAB1503116.1 hypothetical protein F7230_06165 [Corynebacterium sp. 320]KAB1551032.1 hypothetical protein F7232_08200 [Corynebacterium sp. 319]KAB3526913.1 hypothetical protein F8354_06165 [Corynebacterium sp. 250]KAB3538406.1 hypothetical protein F8390_09065 [Corynebacterium sp. 366]QNP92473.1 hypothetical protein IAU67_01150 [Corynebacterium zhongnanshanii]
MTSPVVALLLGLVLVAAAVWLLLRQRSQGGGGDSSSFIPTPTSERSHSSRGTERASDDPAAAARHDGTAASRHSGKPSAGSAGESGSDAAPQEEYLGLEPEVAPTEEMEGIIENTPAGVLEIDRSAEREAASASKNFDVLSGGRRKRRAWAQAHECEYVKTDAHVADDWPQLVLGRVEQESGETPVLRDVVSGFFRGYPVIIGDVNRSTVLAMRRAEPSPAHVVYTVHGELPHGLRRAERCDHDPYFAFTNDIRALDRMLDDRVLDGLAALSQVADHIEWEGRWLYVRISRKLDTSVWDQILPHQFHMANAAMVLPPMYSNVPLEFERADPTRAVPGSEWSIPTARDSRFELPDAAAEDAAAGEAEAETCSETGSEVVAETGAESRSDAAANTADGAAQNRPGYLRAVPDAGANSAHADRSGASADRSGAVDDEVGGDQAGSGETGQDADESDPAGSTASTDSAGAAHTSVPDPHNPDITRPAAKVVFPTRARSRTEGDMEDYSASHLTEETHTLPKLGEDPDHISPSTAQRPHVLRADAGTKATIFDDVDEPDVDYVEPEFDRPGEEAGGAAASGPRDEEPRDEMTQADVLASRRREKNTGKHRAPDARHARPEPIEPVEIETVDAEIVDINHNKNNF